MTPADVADRLHARPTGAGRWVARCAAHPDRTPSLAIREGDGGRVLLLCRAGCSTGDVLRAAGPSWRDIGGAPATPAERARLAREREERLAAEAALRRQARARTDVLRRADGTLAALAAQLAAVTFGGAPGDGDTLAREYHVLLAARREAEVADGA